MAAGAHRLDRYALLQTGRRPAGRPGRKSANKRPVPLTPKKTLSTVRVDARERADRWREMAARLARQHPNWGTVEIARAIQATPEGKRKGGRLPYTIAVITKYIRTGS